ncbi:YbaB/EbfC family nucleoid-associated protein [Desertivirga arenae]|uniref:YbaB/EbfC family nucleoid-associated protein n=1 Tax=Desertivirga arenae TaxID=2810309 RepID=UPI001A95B810|nr:YbaB/EbfC family nucleoid-associated protein [Pedobacter sp. SYSU D00823]
MFDKLLQVQQQAEEIKKRLDTVIVSGEAEAGKIKVTSTGNKSITSITIDENFLKEADKEELEELLVVAVNKALAQAESVHQSEMAAASQNMLGNLGNLFGG